MTQEDKELLLRDLCARLPYGVKVKVKYYDDNWRLLAIYTNDTTYVIRDIGYPIETYFEDCKPYLFPLSSMTEEQKEELFFNYIHNDIDFDDFTNYFLAGELWHDICVSIYDLPSLIDWLNKNHFDYRGLIKKGLAIDATGLNIY